MKVLVIDDELLVRRSLMRAFAAQGHEVFTAEDGESGLEAWLKVQPDIVFLDVLMPKMTGPQLLHRIGALRKGKLVVMSAYTGENSSDAFVGLNADQFIAKPFQDIFAIVRNAEELVGATKN